MGLRIAIDTGGTFTDIVAIDEDTGDITATKTPSTPDDPSVGLVEGVRKVLKAAGGEPTDVHMLLHGSTVATNAVLEHKFDGLGLLVTKGFRHLIEIARQSVPDGYGNSFFWVKPRRLVPLHLVREVPRPAALRRQRARAARRGRRDRGACRNWSKTACAASPCACCTLTPTTRTKSASAN